MSNGSVVVQDEGRQHAGQPAQHQTPPGREAAMDPAPVVIRAGYRGTGRLAGLVALVTGGDSGIGRAVAVHFAHEGADVMIAYLSEHDDAEETCRMVEAAGQRSGRWHGDLGEPAAAEALVARTIERFRRIDILVNNAAEQHPKASLAELHPDQLERTFKTNIFSMFHVTRAALPHLAKGAAIINTTSVTAYRGSSHLVDYAATKGAIVSFTRSLASQLASQGIRVNAVAPGPIWTPLIPSTFPAEAVAKFGTGEPLGRPGQPADVAPAYVFLASADAAYMTGQVLHPNGGEPVES